MGKDLTHHILPQKVQLVTLELIDLLLEGLHLPQDSLRVSMEGTSSLLLPTTQGACSCHLVGCLGRGHGLQACVRILIEGVRVIINVHGVEGGVITLRQRQMCVGCGIRAGWGCPCLTAATTTLATDTLWEYKAI